MLENGFIMLPRSITNWQWYDEANTMRIFLHLLLTANYTDRSWHGVPVLRGQRICTYEYEDLFTGEKLEINSVWMNPYQYRWCVKK